MKRLKQFTALCLATIVSFSLVACSGTKATTEVETTDAETTEAEATEAEATEAKDVTLTVLSIATESDTFHPAYLKAIEEFEAAHPGVTIKFETFEVIEIASREDISYNRNGYE